MTGSVFLDTSVIIPHLRRGSKRIEKPTPESSLYVSHIVLGELYYGAYYSENPGPKIQAIETIAPAFELLPLDDATVRVYGEIKAHLRKQGTPLPENDVWIAATATRHSFPLATHDAHFQ